ncbi:MAG: hypothetical protein DYG89_15120 [Caldilinea sp. CFX5]|nr:hypothetical protein [Caldilinea sp. CFX5]
MSNKELLKELRDLRMLLDALHSDARGNGHGPVVPASQPAPFAPFMLRFVNTSSPPPTACATPLS